MEISGEDWIGLLKDKTTTSQSIVDSTIAVTLAAILSEVTDITVTVEVIGIMEIITTTHNWDTTLEMLLLESLTDVGIVQDVDTV